MRDQELKAAHRLERCLDVCGVGGEVAEHEHGRLVEPFARVATEACEVHDPAMLHDPCAQPVATIPKRRVDDLCELQEALHLLVLFPILRQALHQRGHDIQERVSPWTTRTARAARSVRWNGACHV